MRSVIKHRLLPAIASVLSNCDYIFPAMDLVEAAPSAFSSTNSAARHRLDIPSSGDDQEDPPQFVFKPRFCIKTGKLEWVAMDAAYDYTQEIARSKYGDMLHDHDRNVMYHEALEKVIVARKAAGESVHVLDIGTGTGILAMMAMSLGADRVTACEAFQPIAEVAKKCIAENGLDKRIKLVGKRSTAMDLSDMHSGSKANVVVAEVFDTELIGEGALSTFRTALQNLLTDDAVTIPHSAECFVQLMSSKKLSEYCRFHPTLQVSADLTQSMNALRVPDNVTACAGLNTVWDAQFSDLLQNFSPEEVEIMPNPVPCGEFEFSNRDAACFQNSYIRQLVSKFSVPRKSITIDALVFWWVLHMDKERMLTIDTRPRLFTDTDQPPVERSAAQKPWYWRDHWIQGIYMLPKPIVLNQDSGILRAQHDEYSWNFDISENSPEGLATEKIKHPGCTCGWHMRLSTARIAELNDADTNSRWYKHITSMIRNRRTPVRNLLFVGDFSFVPFIAQLCLSSDAVVWVLCSDDSQWKMYEQMITANAELRGKIQRTDREQLPHIDCCISDVYFSAYGTVGSLPWEHALMLSNMISSNPAVKAALQSGQPRLPMHDGDTAAAAVNDDVIMMPSFAVIYAMPVRFDHLHKNRVPVGTIAGFNLSQFDNLIDRAIEDCDDAVEPYRLCEYPAKCVAKPKALFCISLMPQSSTFAAECFAKQLGCSLVASASEDMPLTECFTQFPIPDLTGAVDEINGLTLWADYYGNFSSAETERGDANGRTTLISSTGYVRNRNSENLSLSPEFDSGKYVRWNRFRSQGVYLLPLSIPLHARSASSYSDSVSTSENRVLNITVQLDLDKAYLSVKNISLAYAT